MRILINENNEIIGYAKVGSLNNDFEVEDSIVLKILNNFIS
ncbi:DUF2977 domain-containing protein [Staphylococcus sp. FDAARGOS_39]